MKLYAISLPNANFREVHSVAKNVDPYALVSVNEGTDVYEFQSKLAADEVARVFNAEIKVIEYNIKDLMK